MDYQRIYDQFIADRRSKEGVVNQGERHHVHPSSLGGSDEASNMILLSCQDHLFSHLLLAKIHGGSMAVAFKLMLGMERYKGRHSRHKYERLRDEAIRFSRELNTGRRFTTKAKGQPKPWMRGKAPWNKGVKMPPEYGAKVSASLIGKKQSPELIAARAKGQRGNTNAKALKGYKQTPEHVAKRIHPQRGKSQPITQTQNRLASYLANGRVLLGRKQSPEHVANAKAARKVAMELKKGGL